MRSGTRDLPQMLSKSCPLMLQVMLFAAFQEQEICSDGRWHERTRHGTGRLLLHSIFFRRYVMKSAGHAFLRTVPKIETRFARRGWVVTSVIVPNLLALTTVMDARENTKGTCIHCKKKNICHKLCGLGRKATACTACAKAHDPEWYAAYENMQGTCTHCDKSKISTNLCGLGRKATACKACAKAHDPEWYAAYESMQGTCTHCDKSKISTNLCGLGRKATACITCAKAHDPEWYAAYENMRRCIYHPTTACSSKRRPDLDGYCGRCFTHLFPGDPRTKFIRTCVHHKEMAVRAFLQERFPDVTWSFDRKITDGCSSRRPDAFAHIGSHVISVEIDEFEHTDYDCSCQNRRTMELFEDAGRLPHVFVRFNPDEYYLHGEKIQGCWGKNPNTGEPRLAPKHRKQWEQRLEKLADIIEHFRSHAPSKEVESVFLFYSDC